MDISRRPDHVIQQRWVIYLILSVAVPEMIVFAALGLGY